MTKQTAIEALRTNGELTQTEAEDVFSHYLAIKVMKSSARGYELAHGAFFDKDTIRKVLQVVTKGLESYASQQRND